MHRLYILLFLFSFAPHKGDDTGDWVLKSNTNGIAVYERTTAGSSIKSVKAVFMVHAGLQELVAILLDIKAYPQWIYKCTKAEVLKKEGPLELIYYQYTNVPWPASDRDLVAKMNIVQEADRKVIARHEAVPEQLPEKPGVVRLKKFESIFYFIPKPEGMVEVTNEVNVDPGGNIPAWMVNRGATKGPYETAVGIKKVIESGAYKKETVPGIEEPAEK